MTESQNLSPVNFCPLRQVPSNSPYKQGDVLVLFGELFSRGYANGLVEEAQKVGMTIVHCTVGRRDSNGELRALNPEETLTIPEPFINIALEAGFDYETDSEGRSPIDRLKDVKLSDWESFQIKPELLEECRLKGETRFRAAVQKMIAALSQIVPDSSNILFAHLMAGGVPRTKIVMPLMNRVVKGIGDRYLSSKTFWDSDIGKVCSASFEEVTANSFKHLVEQSEPLRKRQESHGNHVQYLAYGYHGTEVFYDEKFQWQTYTPYLQGWAKIKLENYSRKFYEQGIKCVVFNCPEILTASSSIFQGVEISLYPLLTALKNSHNNEIELQRIIAQCRSLLINPESLELALQSCEGYLKSPESRAYFDFKKWPQHSGKAQLEKMLEVSDFIGKLHKNPKQLISANLSELVFKACGYIMFHSSWNPTEPVVWIGHDLIAKTL